MTIIDATMHGILDALSQAGWVPHSDVRAAVLARGGKIRRMTEATKRLHDMGFPITIDQRRHLTRWTMKPNDIEQETHHRRILRDAHSEFLSFYKALVGAQAQAPSLATYRAIPDVEAACISTGRALGKSLVQIAADLAPATNTTGRTP